MSSQISPILRLLPYLRLFLTQIRPRFLSRTVLYLKPRRTPQFGRSRATAPQNFTELHRTAPQNSTELNRTAQQNSTEPPQNRFTVPQNQFSRTPPKRATWFSSAQNRFSTVGSARTYSRNEVLLGHWYEWKMATLNVERT